MKVENVISKERFLFDCFTYFGLFLRNTVKTRVY